MHIPNHVLSVCILTSGLSGCFSNPEDEAVDYRIRHGAYEYHSKQKVPCVPSIDGNTDSATLKTSLLFQDYGKFQYHSSLNEGDLCIGTGYWHQYSRKMPDSIQSIKNILQFSEVTISCKTLDSISVPSGGYQHNKSFDFIEYEVSKAEDSEISLARLFSSSDTSSNMLVISDLESHLNRRILEDCGVKMGGKLPMNLEKTPFDQKKWQEVESSTDGML